VIKKELRVTTQWQTVTFEKPLLINRRGTMGLHLVVDQAPYISTTDDDPRNLDCSDAEYQLNAFSLHGQVGFVLVRTSGDKSKALQMYKRCIDLDEDADFCRDGYHTLQRNINK
jgi:hypothetical protein